MIGRSRLTFGVQITLVGVGAVGSAVLPLLRNLDCHIRIIDYDRVEAKNIQSQFFSAKSVGTNKANAAAQLMGFLFGRAVEALPHKLTPENAQTLLANSSLVIDCLDNAPARWSARNAARMLGVPCLHTGLAEKGTFGQIRWGDRFNIVDNPGGAPTCEDGEALAFISMFAGFVGVAVREFLRKQTQMGFLVYPSGAQLVL